MRRWLLVLAVLAAGCGGSDATLCDLTVDGVCISLGNTTTTELDQSTGPARLRAELDAALAYWGGTWDDLSGWTIQFNEGDSGCGRASVNGCTYQDERLMRVWLPYPPCFESSELLHEVGHVVIFDPGHADPRWSFKRECLASERIIEAEPLCVDVPRCPAPG